LAQRPVDFSSDGIAHPPSAHRARPAGFRRRIGGSWPMAPPGADLRPPAAPQGRIGCRIA
jgi:hypothetical protein